MRTPECVEVRKVYRAIDIFHLYGRSAILDLYLWDAELENYYAIPKFELREWVKSLEDTVKFSPLECMALIDKTRANLSVEEMKSNWANYRDKEAQKAPQLPGGYRKWLYE